MEEIVALLDELSWTFSNIQTRKGTLILLVFLDEIINYHQNNQNVIIKVFSLYCEILLSSSSIKILIYKSIQNILMSSNFSNSDPLIKITTKMVDYFNYFLKSIDLNDSVEELDMVEAIIETMQIVILNVNVKNIQNQTNSCLVDFVKSLLTFVDIEVSLVSNVNLDESTKANMFSSIYFMNNYFDDRYSLQIRKFFSSIDEYELTFRQVFFENIKCFVSINTITKDQFRYLLPQLCQVCTLENDFELQIILLDTIDVICFSNVNFVQDNKTSIDQFVEFKLFSMLYTLLHDELVSDHVKLRTISFYEKLNERFKLDLHNYICSFKSCSNDNEPTNGTIGQVTISQIVDFFTNFQSKFLAEKLSKSLERPTLNILDDIITTSKLSEDYVMDCY